MDRVSLAQEAGRTLAGVSGRVANIFASLHREGRTALMPFVTAGHPTRDATAATIVGMHQAGAAFVEVGIPFSDPIADGPVIAASMHRALQDGVTPSAAFEMVAAARARTEGGIIAMVSWSIVSRIGPATFLSQAAKSGIDGVILPDIDTADAGSVAEHCDRLQLALGLLVAPGSSDMRVREIVRHCRQFVYLLARAGLTGERDTAPQIEASVARIRTHTNLPIAAGFGVSSASHVSAVTAHADGAIVGSALVRRMESAVDPVAAAVSFTRELAVGLAQHPPKSATHR